MDRTNGCMQINFSAQKIVLLGSAKLSAIQVQLIKRQLLPVRM